MSLLKNNNSNISKYDFIHYLFSECRRKSDKNSSLLYEEVVKFVNSADGHQSFQKFILINPAKLGIVSKPVNKLLKRAF